MLTEATEALHTALGLAGAILLGCLPLFLAAALAALLFPMACGRPQWIRTAWATAAAGLGINGLWWVRAPQYLPTRAIARVQAQQRALYPPQPQPMAPNPLVIVASGFRWERLGRQRLTSAMQITGRTVRVPTAMRGDIWVLVWLVQLRNTGATDIKSLRYVPEFLDAQGAGVSRTAGLSEQARSDPRYNCSLVSQDQVAFNLRAGEERTLILRELVSRRAARRIVQARITLTPLY